MKRAANVAAGALGIERRGSFQHNVIGRDGDDSSESQAFFVVSVDLA